MPQCLRLAISKNNVPFESTWAKAIGGTFSDWLTEEVTVPEKSLVPESAGLSLFECEKDVLRMLVNLEMPSKVAEKHRINNFLSFQDCALNQEETLKRFKTEDGRLLTLKHYLVCGVQKTAAQYAILMKELSEVFELVDTTGKAEITQNPAPKAEAKSANNHEETENNLNPHHEASDSIVLKTR
jgi:hypothetical protein